MLHQRTRTGAPALAALSIALLLAACGGQTEAPSDTAAQPAAAPAANAVITAVVYDNARVIRGDGSAPIENASFVVDGGRFFGVGTPDSIAIPAGATHVDLAGATVMPAIIDTHVHLSTERAALIEDLRIRATFGVSAALSMGIDDGDDVYSVRRQRPPAGLALYRTAGRGLVGPEPGRTEVPHWVTTPDEARAAVQEEAAKDVDIIKIWVDDRNGQFEKLTPDIYGAAIDEAHANGLRAVAHIFNLEDAKGLLDAGVDAFAHGVRDVDVDDAIIGQLQGRSDFVLGANLPGRGVPTDLEWLRGRIPDAQLEQLLMNNTENPEAQTGFALQARNLMRMFEAGITVVLGTDGNSPFGPHIEMEDMVAAGMSPADVITSATGKGAAYMGLRDRGVIATGKTADFIVLDANPLEDITNTRRIRDVFLRGERVAR